MKCLEIGPGTHPANCEWDTLDIVSGGTYKSEWGEGLLPILDETYDFVFASHVLEHVPWFQVENALREALRILKPGGKLQVWVPNFKVIVQAYLDGVCGDTWRKENPNGEFMTWVNGRLFTYGPAPNWHRCVFDSDSIRDHMIKAGFASVRKLDRHHVFNFHGDIGLGVEATK